MDVHVDALRLRLCGGRSRAKRSPILAVAFLVCGLCGSTPARAELGSAADTFRTTANPGGGSITTGTAGPSVSAAVARLMGRVRTELGVRPVIVQAVKNARDGSVALLFTATRNGTPYTGVALVTVTPGAPAGAAALYDTSARFTTTFGPMMRRLETMTTPGTSPGLRKALAPPEPLVAHPFADGTGSISVPAGWAVPVAGGGSAAASAPGGEAQVAYNMHFTGVDPSDPRAQTFLRTASPLARQNLHGAVLPYTDDPVRAWVGMYEALAKQRGFQSEIHVTSSSSGGASGADFSGTLGSGAKTIHFIAHAFVLPPNPMGMWGLSDSHIFVNESALTQKAATANAVLGSVKINFGAVAAQQDAIRKMFQARFDADIANDRAQDAARQARTDEALANDRTAQEGMHKRAVAMENYSLDRAVIINTTTGEHDTVDSGFAAALVRDDPDYRNVPAADLLRGIDY